MKNIMDYLENDPLYYDFSNDCTESREYKEKRGFEKYFIYHSPKPEGKEIYPAAVSVIGRNYQRYGKIGDPDSESKLLQNIYSCLWPEIKKRKSEYMINSSNGWIYSDNMISAQSTLNSYIGKQLPEILKTYNVKRVSKKMCLELYESNSAFRKLLDESEDLAHFINVYHTLGNYIAVPFGFNISRSGFCGSYDYWDLTLIKIKEYYDAKIAQSGCEASLVIPELKIMELLHCDRKVLCCCRWLNSFEGWSDFINRNFLQDFIDSDNQQPIPLCEGHSWDCPQVQNFTEFFKNSWKSIEKRGVRMIKMLKKKTSI